MRACHSAKLPQLPCCPMGPKCSLSLVCSSDPGVYTVSPGALPAAFRGVDFLALPLTRTSSQMFPLCFVSNKHPPNLPELHHYIGMVFSSPGEVPSSRAAEGAWAGGVLEGGEKQFQYQY